MPRSNVVSTSRPARWLSVLLIGACGPDAGTESEESDWMLGVYSSRGAGELGHADHVTHYELRADGKFLVRGFNRCGMETREEEEHTWKRVGADAIEVEFLAGSSWRVTPGEDCNEIRIQPNFATQPEVDYTILRGEVCVRSEACGPDVGECVRGRALR